MEYYLVIYSSITLANRVKRRVAKDGSYVGIIHTPKCISKGGCSYAIRCKKHKLADVKKVSAALKITIRGIYREINEDGNKVYYEV
ncbi:MAG: DUF3343 domain-containing protein [Firmicutes bacterium]|nr:DUF3343 domain-containing protein [Bacillota bacterium]